MGKITRQELAPSLREELDNVTEYVDGTDAQALGNHLVDEENPHNVTKAQIGLSELDNVKQAPLDELNAHISHPNPHNITPEKIGAVPTTRSIYAGTGLRGGGALNGSRELSIDTSWLSQNYIPRTGGGSITGFLSSNNYIRAKNIMTNIVENNGHDSINHMYVRPQSGMELRVTRQGTSSTYEDVRARKFLNQQGDEAYHKGANIRWGTSNPSGGQNGDIYIQY